MASDEEKCELISSFTVACKTGYSEQGDIKMCSEDCRRGRRVKVKEGSCEEPQLKASVKSKSLDIGYLRKKISICRQTLKLCLLLFFKLSPLPSLVSVTSHIPSTLDQVKTHGSSWAMS